MIRYVHICTKKPIAKDKKECLTCEKHDTCEVRIEYDLPYGPGGKYPTELPVDLYGPRPSPEERRL